MTHRALDGLKVVDFTTMIAGAGASRMLADCGATVFKIEAPEGDLLRAFHRNYGLYNVGKKSIVLDLKNSNGVKVALDLIAKADIVLENFRPGIMKRFGLDYSAAKAAQPSVIYCSISGFGQYGQLSPKPAYAPVAHAFSGFDLLVASSDDPDAPPITNTLMLADYLTPAYAFGAIQTAIIHRLRTGEGAHIDVTMAESMMQMLGMQFIRGQEGATSRQDYKMSAHPPYKTLDGYINVPIASVATQHALFRTIGREDWLDDPDFRSVHGLRTRRTEVNAVLAEWAKTKTSADCDALLSAGGVPCSIYYLPNELMEHPHLIERGAFSPVEFEDETIQVLNQPFQFDGAPVRPAPFVSALGSDAFDVLASELGIDRKGFETLQAQGAFGSWSPPPANGDDFTSTSE